jgi:hypothetical protein
MIVNSNSACQLTVVLCRKTQERMNAEVEALQATTVELEAAILQEENNLELLRSRSLGCSSGGTQLFNHTVSLKDLAAKVLSNTISHAVTAPQLRIFTDSKSLLDISS